ncbi:NAD(P)H-binding protein [Nonomuraea sediminis]|uniref:NAD(P)H-binding protein n=1 Tax=Nonomuraea sediminis TaxID=2835864 RepID=UPI001BDD40B4|nr:NAD(P)H-binding protein [Nonomuraea sediminis]
MTILVTGARGAVARRLIQELADARQKVRAAGKAPQAVQAPEGVEVVHADLSRPDTLGPALEGITQMFVYAEPTGLTDVLAQAKQAGVEHVVLLSAAGADSASEDAITSMHGRAEDAVAASGIGWTFLRPGGFATNRLVWARTIRERDVVLDAFPESQSALIHEADIADAAHHVLTHPGHLGATHTLTGPESITLRDQVGILAHALGRPLTVELQSLDDYREALRPFGPPEIVEARIRRLAALVGVPAPTTPTVQALTGHPARSFTTWATDHLADFS